MPKTVLAGTHRRINCGRKCFEWSRGNDTQVHTGTQTSTHSAERTREERTQIKWNEISRVEKVEDNNNNKSSENNLHAATPVWLWTHCVLSRAVGFSADALIIIFDCLHFFSLFVSFRWRCCFIWRFVYQTREQKNIATFKTFRIRHILIELFRLGERCMKE